MDSNALARLMDAPAHRRPYPGGLWDRMAKVRAAEVPDDPALPGIRPGSWMRVAGGAWHQVTGRTFEEYGSAEHRPELVCRSRRGPRLDDERVDLSPVGRTCGSCARVDDWYREEIPVIARFADE